MRRLWQEIQALGGRLVARAWGSGHPAVVLGLGLELTVGRPGGHDVDLLAQEGRVAAIAATLPVTTGHGSSALGPGCDGLGLDVPRPWSPVYPFLERWACALVPRPGLWAPASQVMVPLPASTRGLGPPAGGSTPRALGVSASVQRKLPL